MQNDDGEAYPMPNASFLCAGDATGIERQEFQMSLKERWELFANKEFFWRPNEK